MKGNRTKLEEQHPLVIWRVGILQGHSTCPWLYGACKNVCAAKEDTLVVAPSYMIKPVPTHPLLLLQSWAKGCWLVHCRWNVNGIRNLWVWGRTAPHIAACEMSAGRFVFKQRRGWGKIVHAKSSRNPFAKPKSTWEVTGLMDIIMADVWKHVIGIHWRMRPPFFLLFCTHPHLLSFQSGGHSSYNVGWWHPKVSLWRNW